MISCFRNPEGSRSSPSLTRVEVNPQTEASPEVEGESVESEMRPVSPNPASLTPKTIVASFRLWTDDQVPTPPMSLDPTRTNYATLHRRCQGQAARFRGQISGAVSGDGASSL